MINIFYQLCFSREPWLVQPSFPLPATTFHTHFLSRWPDTSFHIDIDAVKYKEYFSDSSYLTSRALNTKDPSLLSWNTHVRETKILLGPGFTPPSLSGASSGPCFTVLSAAQPQEAFSVLEVLWLRPRPPLCSLHPPNDFIHNMVTLTTLYCWLRPRFPWGADSCRHLLLSQLHLDTQMLQLYFNENSHFLGEKLCSIRKRQLGGLSLLLQAAGSLPLVYHCNPSNSVVLP